MFGILAKWKLHKLNRSFQESIMSGDYEKAILVNDEIYKLINSKSDHFYRLGIINHFTKKNEIAIQNLKNAINIEPSIDGYYDLLASCYEEVGNISEAHETYNKMLSLNPSGASHYANYGMFLENQGVVDTAIEMYEEAIKRAKVEEEKTSLLEKIDKIKNA